MNPGDDSVARARFIRTARTADEVCQYVKEIADSPAEAILGLLMAARAICEGIGAPTSITFEEYCREVARMNLVVMVAPVPVRGDGVAQS